MKAEFVNPFITAASDVLEKETSASVQKGGLNAAFGDFESDQVTVIISVTGKVEGHVIYNMKERTAKMMASLMIGEDVVRLDSIAQSAISELGNMISGNAGSGLSAAGYPCRVTPPTMLLCEGTPLSTLRIKRIIVPLITQYGNIDIHIALREKIDLDDDD